jgi:hypothetical protein
VSQPRPLSFAVTPIGARSSIMDRDRSRNHLWDHKWEREGHCPQLLLGHVVVDYSSDSLDFLTS